MKNMTLLEHVKTLKTAIPVPQREQEVHSKLPIFKTIKHLSKKERGNHEGIFVGDSFCFPLLDPPNDPPPKQVTALIRGVFQQGGHIVEFHQRMSEEVVRFAIISARSKLQPLQGKLKGLLKYEKMLSYEYVWECLSKFKKVKVDPYLIHNNLAQLQNQITSMELARIKLEEEALDQKLIRPKLDDPSNQTPKQTPHIGKNLSPEHCLDQKTDVEQKSAQIKVVQDIAIQESDKESITPQIEQEDSHSVDAGQRKQEIGVEVPQNHCLTKEKQSEASKSFGIELKQKRKYKESLKDTKEEEANCGQQPQFQWQNKRDRRVIWFAPPQNLASQSFEKNNFICDKLKEFYEMYSHIQQDTRKFTYVRSIAQIRSHSKEINTVDDLREVQGLSQSVFKKIKELIETGCIAKLEKFSRKNEINACQQLEKVWGIGTRKAKEFYDRGLRTVEDLRRRPDLISKNIAVGLKYFQEFSRRIPREKVTRIFQFLKGVFQKQVLSDRTHWLQVAGSYRRGKATCGDIDLLICRRDGSVEENLVRNFVRELEQKGFITESLSQPRPFTGRNNSAYMGVCFFQGAHHRIDIKHYPPDQYAFALLYFTGSDIFNRTTRMAAHNMGLQLSDHGFSTKERNGKNKIYKGGKIPVLTTEQDIFKFLGLNYCTPEQREM